MKVLVAGIDQTTVAFLREHGVAVEVQTIEGAEDLDVWLQDGLYEACVIDLEQCNVGVYAARSLRAKKIGVSLIGISRGSEGRPWSEHRAMFLENGGDDLLRSPVSPRELTASLRATTRRFKGALLDIVEYRNGGAVLKVNLTTKRTLLNDRDVPLTGKEQSLMLLFASAPGRVLSKEMIIGQMYTGGVDDEPEMKIIDVFICKLRHKLVSMHPDAGAFIKTEWGRGYRLPEHYHLTIPPEEAAA